jgi:hypothetical protein
MKTPEELAEEWASKNTTGSKTYEHGLRNGFLAGYQAAKDQINSSNNLNGWISVKNRLPERDLNVLAWIKCGTSEYVFIETASGDPNMCSGWKHYNKDQVTHWMPLPSSPEVKHED